jgi:hypothetical protein
MLPVIRKPRGHHQAIKKSIAGYMSSTKQDKPSSLVSLTAENHGMNPFRGQGLRYGGGALVPLRWGRFLLTREDNS